MEGFYKSHEPSKAGPTNAQLDLIPWRAPIVFQFYESISILTAKSMTPLIAGNRILTITRDLQDTFIWPAPNRPDWKHFSQSTNDTNLLRNAKSRFCDGLVAVKSRMSSEQIAAILKSFEAPDEVR